MFLDMIAVEYNLTIVDNFNSRYTWYLKTSTKLAIQTD